MKKIKVNKKKLLLAVAVSEVVVNKVLLPLVKNMVTVRKGK